MPLVANTRESNSRRQRHPRALDDEELFVIEGSPKSPLKAGTQRPSGRSPKNALKKGKKNTSDFRAETCWNFGCMFTAARPHVDELHLRHQHGFLHCLNQLVVEHERACQHPPKTAPTATAEAPQLSALSDHKHLSMYNNGRVPIQELHLANLRLLHSLHCEPCLYEATEPTLCRRTESEALHVFDEGLLELELHDHRDSKPEPWRLSPAQYLYPALGWRRAAQTEPVLPATPRFARLRLQKLSQGSSAHPPTVPPAAAREERRGAGPRPEERPWAHRRPAQADFRTSTTESTGCGTGTWRRGTTGTESAICSTVRRGTHPCGLTSMRRSGRAPSVSSSYRSKSTESTLELAVLWLRGASYVTALHLGTKNGTSGALAGSKLHQPGPPPHKGRDLTGN